MIEIICMYNEVCEIILQSNAYLIIVLI